MEKKYEIPLLFCRAGNKQKTTVSIKQSILGRLDGKIQAALKNLYDEIRTLRHHKRGVREAERYLKTMQPLRVQFGCGQCPRQGWLNTDLCPGPSSRPDICLDVSRPLPFPDHSVAEIYSGHMLEHLDYPHSVRVFLSECFRVLERGGVITLGVPDLDVIYARHLSGAQTEPGEKPPHFIIGHPVEVLNDRFRQRGDHKFLYNEQFLTVLLQHFGFYNVHARPFDPAIDAGDRGEGTLYMTAAKP